MVCSRPREGPPAWRVEGRKGVAMFELDLIDVGAAVARITSGKGTAADLQSLIDAGARLIRINAQGLSVDGHTITNDRESIAGLIGRLK